MNSEVVLLPSVVHVEGDPVHISFSQVLFTFPISVKPELQVYVATVPYGNLGKGGSKIWLYSITPSSIDDRSVQSPVTNQCTCQYCSSWNG